VNTGERIKRRNIISERKFGEGNGKYSEEDTEGKKIEDVEKLEWLVAKR
jgi:hypothetical protein